MSRTSNEMLSPVTRALIDEGRKFGAEFGNGLSNHLPMALVALDRMGARPERQRAFFDKYTARLERKVPSEGVIAECNWREHLGQHRLNSDYVAFFDAKIHASPAATIASFLPELAPGVAGGAFHPLIRLAYAVSAEHEGELAEGLGAWAIAYLSLDGPESAGTLASPLEALAALSTNGHFRHAKIVGQNIFTRMATVAADDAFALFRGSVDKDVLTLERIARLAIDLYDSTEDNFTALHMVTACHAVRMLGSATQTRCLINPLWQGIGAAYVTIGMPPIAPPTVPESLPDWQAIEGAAVDSDNDHVIKMAFTCREEAQAYDDRRYQFAAAKKVGLAGG